MTEYRSYITAACAGDLHDLCGSHGCCCACHLVDDVCPNCEGLKCMDCVLRVVHDRCVDDCPTCCPVPPPPPGSPLALEVCPNCNHDPRTCTSDGAAGVREVLET